MWEVEMKAMERLDALENHLSRKEGIFSEGNKRVDLTKLETKVHGSLKKNVKAWEEAGAGAFALSVIEEGFKLNMNMEDYPGDYEEKNNKSFEKNKVFAIEAIDKLVKMKILLEVKKSEVSCVNPLMLAVNDRGKKRLCIRLLNP